MSVTQENRLLSIETPLGKDVLLLQSLTGSEAISNLFSLQLDLLSEAPSISLQSIIGKGVTITLELADGSQRFLHGMVSRVGSSGKSTRFSAYYAEVVPWMWLLTRKVDCRVFQDLTVPEIILKVFDKLKGDFSDLVNYRDALTPGRYTKLDYCVQYRETDFNFVSRLMEQEGIFYFFEHERGKHTLVLADSPPAHKPCPNQPQARYEPEGGTGEGEDIVVSWRMEQQLRSGKYTLRDFHFQMPSKSLEVSEPTTIEVAGNTKLEVYDFPGEYAQRFVQPEQRLDKVEPEGRSLVQLRMQEEEAVHLSITGSSYCRAFAAGTRFDLTHHSDQANGAYVLVSVQHSAKQTPEYYSDAATPDPYRNQFTCMPFALPFRAARATPKPVVQGPQTAMVVGKPGEEIWTDKYGRVKVQFHWDREGKFNENSSCWVRVSHPWAGKGWGSIAIPRIGQEVIVDFLEGDPDQPVITGRVYNAQQMPPYELPKEQTKSATKSLSSKGGQGFNEIRFEDKKGAEQVFVHGEMDLDIRIKNDRREWIGRDRHLITQRDKVEQIDRDVHVIVKRDGIEEIRRDHHVTVGGKEAIAVTGSRSVAVQGDVAEEFHKNHSEEVTGTYYLKGMNVVIEAMTGLTLKVGGNFVTINPAGVQIVGTLVLVNSGGAALSGVAGKLVSPMAALEALVADKAIPGAIAPVPASVPAPTSAAPSHDPNAEENKKKTSWIEIAMEDEAGNPMPGLAYQAKLPDGSVASGTLDEKGVARIENIDPGSCELTFPDFDKEAWEKK